MCPIISFLVAGKSIGGNPIEIFYILTELLRCKDFADLHLINIHEEPMRNYQMQDTSMLQLLLTVDFMENHYKTYKCDYIRKSICGFG